MSATLYKGQIVDPCVRLRVRRTEDVDPVEDTHFGWKFESFIGLLSWVSWRKTPFVRFPRTYPPVTRDTVREQALIEGTSGAGSVSDISRRELYIIVCPYSFVPTYSSLPWRIIPRGRRGSFAAGVSRNKKIYEWILSKDHFLIFAIMQQWRSGNCFWRLAWVRYNWGKNSRRLGRFCEFLTPLLECFTKRTLAFIISASYIRRIYLVNVRRWLSCAIAAMRRGREGENNRS
jgi:hypothetical protein